MDPIAIYENNKDVKITLADKLNGGKADALNLGINLSNHPLFVCLDADSVLQKDALKRIVEPFLEKDRTVAVGGNIRVSNGRSLKGGFIELSKIPTKPIVMFQIIEYIRVFLNSRISLNRMNGNLIISGAFGIYKKEAAVNVGGYSNGLMGEDMEIVVKIHSYYKKNNIPYRTSYVPDAICWTQVPEDLKTLRSQRKRWHIGLEESLSRHKYMFFNPSYGVIGILSYPYFVFFEYLTPLIELLGIITIVASFILDIINIEFLITYLLVYIGYNIVASIVFIIAHTYIFDRDIDRRLLYRVLLYSLLESFGYRQVMSLSRIGGMFKRNKNKEWGEMKRVESE